MRHLATLSFAGLSLLAVASCALDFDSFDFIQFAAGGAGGSGGDPVGSGGCVTFCPEAGGFGGSPSAGGAGGMGTGGGGGTGGMGTGGGVTCNNPNQCPAMDTDCQTPTCEMNVCGVDYAAKGDLCADNGGDVCDGMGDCIPCGNPPTAPGGNMCPAECTGGCTGSNDEICVIACDEPNECAGATLTCPAGFACQVNCTNDNACANATIACPSTYQCTINCNASNACAGADFDCAMDGPCNLSCGNQQCAGGTLTCGDDACAATCQGGAAKPNVVCNDSCSCTPC